MTAKDLKAWLHTIPDESVIEIWAGRDDGGAESYTSVTPDVIRAVVPFNGTDLDPNSSHPLFGEFAALSAPVKEALRHDFRVFLDVRQHGRLDSLVNLADKELGVDKRRTAAERKRVKR